MSYRVSYRSDRGFSLGPIGFLVIINLLMYVATSIRPELFVNLLGFRPAYVLQMPWTIVTAMFIHDPFPRIWHISGNMLTLYFLGSHLTRLIGEGKFLIVYFIGGIVGNVFFMLLAYPFSIAIGASGAVAAVCGALIALRPKLKVMIIPIPIPLPLWAVGIGIFVILSIIVPGVAWQAHLGGLVFGLILGYFFRRRQRRLLWD